MVPALRPVHPACDAVTADLLNIRHQAAINLRAVCALQASADGVGRGALRHGGELQKLRILHRAVVHAAHLEDAFGQRAGLVKNDGFHL